MKTYQIVKMDNLDVILKKIYDIIIEAGLPTTSNAYYLDYVDKIFPDSGTSHDRFKSIPELLEQMTNLELEPYWLGSTIILMYKDHVPPIHRDCDAFGYALNLPVLNTKNTYTIWYENNAPAIETSVQNYLGQEEGNDPSPTFWYYEDQNCTEIDRIELLEPTLLNIDTPHTVRLGECELPRITLSLRLSRDFDVLKFISGGPKG